ncbi:MAG TPA: hypothetical protein VKT73_12910 [Xanthobacteraceae bacterium]|nr:hypothetical protein [Xanthobacteraceae bacterium]
MILLGLDISKRATGWELIDLSNPKFTVLTHGGLLLCPYKPPAEGAVETALDGDYSSRVFDWFDREIFQLVQEFKPTRVAIEQPMPTQGNTNFLTTHLVHGCIGVACRIFGRKSIRPKFVASQTWRAHLGIGRPPKGVKNKSDWYKARAHEWCRANKIEVESDDQAEAACIVSWFRDWIAVMEREAA